MGIIKAIKETVSGSLADQWLEVIEPDDMGDQTVFTGGVKIRNGQNTKGTESTVSNGSMMDAASQTNMQQMQMMQEQQRANRQADTASHTDWTCACGAVNDGKFCSECGKPAPAAEWTCACGAVNDGKFCSECGKPRG